MSLPRFFLTEDLGEAAGDVRLPLSDADAHHAVAVLRVRAGDDIEVVEPGTQRVWRVRVTASRVDGIFGRPVQQLESVPRPKIALVQGVAKGEKMDAIVRQAVEVGAAEILPVMTERSIVRLSRQKAAERGERWRRIARSAAEQSHRDQVPDVRDPVALSEAVATLQEFDGVVVLWEDEHGLDLDAALSSWAPDPETRVALVIGPEGGFSEAEVALLTGVGARVASLGPGILRTETAAIVALALAIHHFGGLGRG